MLLRGMHDHGCDDVYIIVTDMKRQEMDDITEYFKLVCRYAYGRRTCKPSIAGQIQYDRSSSTPVHALKPHSFFDPLRHAAVSRATQAATYTVLSSDRPCFPSNLVRKKTAIHHLVLTPDDLLLPNSLHKSSLRTRRRYLLRFP